MGLHIAELTPTEEAYLVLVLDQYAADLRSAERRRNDCINVLLRDKGIPVGTPVTPHERKGTEAAFLSYTLPDDPPASPDASSPSPE